ncbi:MAG: HAD hydrolase-like protein [Chloroflexi bacterium]|nr:HAD hydrolase-like protein [Chloroflexota bacterium]
MINVVDVYVKAYLRAMKSVYDIDGQPTHMHSGHTQPSIIRMICEDMGLSSDVINAGLKRAVEILTDTTITLLADDLRPAVLPGVVEVLDALKQAGHALALVTGTVSRSARVILERSGLQRYFPVGAFGDEGNERVALLHLAIDRATRTYGLEPDHRRLVVVGDSPRDIQAGKALHARVIAVATGYHTPDMLAQYNPDAILLDFSDRQIALKAILGEHQEFT